MSRTRTALTILACAVTLTACGTSDSNDPSPQQHAGSPPHTSHSGHDHGSSTEHDYAEAATANPRLAITYDGGVMVVDATTLKVLKTLPAEGFTRLAPFGDERHVVLTTGSEFRAIDLGAWSEPHGDHSHHYTGTPHVTDFAVPAEEAGHVVAHEGRTLMFADATGEVTELPTDALMESDDPHTTSWKTEQPHHGVAVPLSGGRTIVTHGNHDERDGVVVLDKSGKVIDQYTDCPGVHGESVTAGGTVVFGCENGAVIYKDGTFTHVDASDPWARIGNHAPDEQSPIVLADYKTHQNAELERPRRISLIDTRDASLKLVNLDTSYSFRSTERGPKGEALVQGTDGLLHILDEKTGKEITAVRTVKPWREPLDWQLPMPNLFAQDDYAYATDPATRSLVKVDVARGKVVERTTLPEVPNELTGVEG